MAATATETVRAERTSGGVINITAWVPPEVRDALAEEARQAERSMSAQVRYILKRHCAGQAD